MKAMHQVRLIFAASVLSFTTLAWACFWDSDTLRTEANGMPGVVEAVTGFFPVYPDEYYQRRIEIAQERLGDDPDRLASYDDIAVSHDRLGDSAAAIEAILPKLEVIERLGDDADDHLYRYHANIGTFHAHRWIRGGGDGEDLSDLEAAREHIAKAIEINPDAHFGREFVQLGAIEWLLDPEAGEHFNAWLGEYPTMLNEMVDQDVTGMFHTDIPESVVEGLTGLIVLGSAWESVDVVGALGLGLFMQEHSSLSTLCGLRIEELQRQGKKSLHPAAFKRDDVELIGLEILDSTLPDSEVVVDFYREARVAAGSFREEHSDFVLQRLEEGLHPDTHEGFFDGEPVPVLPELPNGFFGYAGPELRGLTILTVLVGTGIVGVTSIGAVIWLCRKKIRILSPAS